MTNPYQYTPPAGDPPDQGIPPGMMASEINPWTTKPGQPPISTFQHLPRATSARPELPGGRFHGIPVDDGEIRALFPLKDTVFHVMDERFMQGLYGGYMQSWELPSGLKVSDFYLALRAKGITQCH